MRHEPVLRLGGRATYHICIFVGSGQVRCRDPSSGESPASIKMIALKTLTLASMTICR